MLGFLLLLGYIVYNIITRQTEVLPNATAVTRTARCEGKMNVNILGFRLWEIVSDYPAPSVVTLDKTLFIFSEAMAQESLSAEMYPKGVNTMVTVR